MGDSLKLFKDKRHRSSSSIAGVALDGTFSERKLDIKASIPEGDDQFVIAEARCEDLQEKIDLVKMLKKKRKLKKRSTTRIVEQHLPEENVPFISVRTQPKKKSPRQAARGFKDPDAVEQHRMINEKCDKIHEIKGYHPGGRACGDGSPGLDGTEIGDGIAASEEGSTPRNGKKSRERIPRSIQRQKKRVHRGYEMSTIASRLKQKRAYPYVATTNATNIPFITSTSICPSHNLGINIQQVLNGVKTQQPPSGIPTTIAHLMGLRRSTVNGRKSSHPIPVMGVMAWNSIKLNKPNLKLPIHKISYKRLLKLLREGEGKVPRYLSGVNGPHYSLPDCKHPDAEGYFDDDDDDEEHPSSLRATASTAGIGYH